MHPTRWSVATKVVYAIAIVVLALQVASFAIYGRLNSFLVIPFAALALAGTLLARRDEARIAAKPAAPDGATSSGTTKDNPS